MAKVKNEVEMRTRPEKKKGGCFAKLIFLVLLMAFAYVGYFFWKHKDADSLEEAAGDFVTQFKKDVEYAKSKGEGLLASIDEDLLKDLDKLSADLQAELKSILKEDEAAVKKDVVNYQKEQSKERKIEVKKEMEAIREEKKISRPKTNNKIKDVDIAVELNTSSASEDELEDAIKVLLSDVEVREGLFSKNKRKNKDQLKIAITHARLAKQFLRRAYERNPNNDWVQKKMRLTSIKIRSLIALQDEH